MQRYILLLLPLLLTQCASLKNSAYRDVQSTQSSVVKTKGFKETLEVVAKAKWNDGTHLKTLENGDAFYPAMRKAVRNAKKSITFETFTMVSGTETFYFCQALAAKAKEGVKVHVILDGIGSRNLGKVCTDILVNGGVELELYRVLTPILGLKHNNNRDHRKLLIVDGNVAYTGGAGYSNSWMGDARNPMEWRDTMYEITGKAVADMQRTFADNWEEITKVKLSGDNYFPPLKSRGDYLVQVNMGAPREQGDTVGASYLLAIDAAKKSILIEHAYFAPNRVLRAALKRARDRGVEVKVILPGDPIDSKILRETSKIGWPTLMASGVEIYEFQNTMMHSKLMVIDDYLTITGSGNFDDRTYFINDEVNVHVLSKKFALEQKEMFYRDLKRCKRVFRKDARVEFKKIPLRIGAFFMAPQL